MSWSNSSVTYGYTVTLNMESIVNAIIEKLVGDNDEWELDGDNLIIYQKDKTCCRVWYCKATREDPEEYDKVGCQQRQPQLKRSKQKNEGKET